MNPRADRVDVIRFEECETEYQVKRIELRLVIPKLNEPEWNGELMVPLAVTNKPIKNVQKNEETFCLSASFALPLYLPSNSIENFINFPFSVPCIFFY